MIACCVVLLLWAAAPTATPKIASPKEQISNPSEDVSLVQLIATPEKYDGKRVRLIAYVSLEFEGTAAYLHSDDFTHSISSNAIWLDVHPSPGKPRYMLLEGTFCASCTGHLGMIKGALSKITRMEPWDLRRNPCQEQREEIAGIERETPSDYRTRRLERARTVLNAMGCEDEPAK